jgi:hypothetical protein
MRGCSSTRRVSAAPDVAPLIRATMLERIMLAVDDLGCRDLLA